MNIETAHYIVRHFSRLLLQEEAMALRHSMSMTKFAYKVDTFEGYTNSEAYKEEIEWLKAHNQITDNPAVLQLLNSGSEQFYINIAARIDRECHDKIYFNYCKKCGQLARTPYARQCKKCGYNWHSEVAADFKVNSIFSLQARPDILCFIGHIIKGTVKEGMKMDLTFLGASLKPYIESVDFVDNKSENNTQIALEVTITATDDREYLKSYGVLAIPIIIENQNIS